MNRVLFPTDDEAVHAMRKSGTEFMKRLADAWLVADPMRRAKLKMAFPQDFEQYRQLARLRAMDEQVRAEALKAFDQHAPRIAASMEPQVPDDGGRN
jgi:hypothetical protein